MTGTASTERAVTIEELTPDTSYDVQVRASNDEGTGDWSDSGTGATLAAEPEWNYVVIPWLARFARTAAGHVLAGVEGRFDASAASSSQASLAGHAVTSGGEAAAPAHDPAALAVEPIEAGSIEFRELVAGSSFNLASPPPDLADGAGGEDRGRWALWGRGDWSRFTGEETELTLDGSVITSTLGADFARGRVLAGLALAYTSGTGSFQAGEGDSGGLSGSLLSVHPYLRLGLQERLAVWGLLGFGVLGELGLAPDGAPAVTAELGLLMGAAGAYGTLVPAAQGGGLELTAKADGLLLRARAADLAGLVRAVAEVSRLRVLLEAGYRDLMLFGGLLSPALEIGVRYDDGDAERGAGLVLGGRLDYLQEAWGLTLTVAGQGLLLHQDASFREWQVGGSLRFDPGTPGVGLALSVAPSWGSASTSPRSLWALPDASALSPDPAGPRTAADLRLQSELSYGLALPGAALTPYLGLSGTPSGTAVRTWRLGTQLRVDGGFTLSLEGERREAPNTLPSHTLIVSGTLLY